MTHYCAYCGEVTEQALRIADSVTSNVKGEKRLKQAAQYIAVCETHRQQLEQSVANGKVKRSIRPKVITGQITVEDYLR